MSLPEISVHMNLVINARITNFKLKRQGFPTLHNINVKGIVDDMKNNLQTIFFLYDGDGGYTIQHMHHILQHYLLW